MTTVPYRVTLELPDGMNSNEGREWLATHLGSSIVADPKRRILVSGVKRINKQRKAAVWKDGAFASV